MVASEPSGPLTLKARTWTVSAVSGGVGSLPAVGVHDDTGTRRGAIATARRASILAAVGWLGLLIALVGCTADDAELIVDVRTDVVPATEFAAAEVVVGGEGV